MYYTQVMFLRRNVPNVLIFLFVFHFFKGVPGFDSNIEGSKGLKGEPGRQVIMWAFESKLVMR